MDANQNQLIEMIRDRFDNMDGQLNRLNDTLTEHVNLDAQYWKKIDAQEAQLTLLKWIGGLGGGSGLGTALWQWFRH